MKKYIDMSKSELADELNLVKEEYNKYKDLNLNLNIARGKPGKEQLDLVSDILSVLTPTYDFSEEGFDVRNYGNVDGIPSAKKLFADILGTKPENVFVGGNASLQLMYDVISKAFTHGLLHSERPWANETLVRWICPAPGYDRHFKVTETFGVEMITVPLTENGPDMDLVEKLVKDPCVKGMWCVPKYSNPDGFIYSDEVIRRIAALKPAAKDFTLMWDNAYCIHEFKGEFVPFVDIISECEKYGNADMVFEFASTSKITFPGAGIACFATSKANMEYITKLINIQTIGFDKTNQLRHVLYLKDKENTLKLMKKHADILCPKFEAVLDALNSEIGPRGIGNWMEPNGGYFISFYSIPGCAKEISNLCKEAGLTMTGAGATYPYGNDPENSNLRIAPSLPNVQTIKQAMELFCICIRYASLEKMLGLI